MHRQSTLEPDAIHSAVLTPSEAGIAALWAEFLTLPKPLEPTDNFFALGGDSLAMTMLLFRIKEELGVDVPPAALLESPQLRAFCAQIDYLVASGR